MRSWVIIGIMVLAMFFLAGCTTIPGSFQGPGTAGTLVPGPVVTLPAANAVDVAVMQKDSVDSTIDVVFGGGNGQVAVSSCIVVITRSDGSSEIQRLTPQKGSTVTLQGTKGTDRVEVSVILKDGKSYKIIDELVPYRTRG